MSCSRHGVATNLRGGKIKSAAQLINSQHVPIQPPQSANKRSNKAKEPVDKEDVFSTLGPAAQHVAAQFPSRADHINFKGREHEDLQRAAIEHPQSAKDKISVPYINEQAKSPWWRSVVPLADLTNSTAIFSSNRQEICADEDLRNGRGKRAIPADVTLAAASNSKDSVKPAAQLPKSQHLPIQLLQSARKRSNKVKESANEETLEPAAQLVKYQRRNYEGKELEEFQHAALELPQSPKKVNQKGKLSSDIENFLSTSEHSAKFHETQHQAVQRMLPSADITYSTALSSNRQNLRVISNSKSRRDKRVALADFTLAVASNSEDSVKPVAQLSKSRHASIQPAQSAEKRKDRGKGLANEEGIISAPESTSHLLTHQYKNSKGKGLGQFKYAAVELPQSAKNRTKKGKLFADIDNLISPSKPSRKLPASEHQAVQLPWSKRDRNYEGKEPSDPEKVASLGQPSCPPVNRLNSIWNKDAITEEGMPENEVRQISCFESRPERKHRRHSAPVTNMPLDFVEKQRAYFAEIDAFELPVEEVSDESE